MDLIYLIVSSDSFTIQRRIEEIASKNPQATIVHYDLREVPIERAIEDLDTCNFFEQEKIVVCEQAFFLSTEKKRGAIEHNLESLEKYVTHPNPDNRLVLVTDSLDKRKKIVSLCLAHTTLLEGEVSFQEYIRKHLDGYIIDKDTPPFSCIFYNSIRLQSFICDRTNGVFYDCYLRHIHNYHTSTYHSCNHTYDRSMYDS